MMVPEVRFIVWAGVLTGAIAILAALGYTAGAAAAAALAAFAVLAAADALFAMRRIEGLRAAFPEVARLTKGREGIVNIEMENQQAALRRLRIALSFPPEIQSPQDTAMIALEGSRRSWIAWPCTALKRGNFSVQDVYVEAISPLGFWAARRALPARGEVRVYPNTALEQRNLAAMFLNRGMFGVHAHRQIGKGREFEKLREYIPGDNFEDIHWKATAKRGHPVTKLFQIERTQEVYVVIDASRLGARKMLVQAAASSKPDLPVADAPVTQLERFITAAMVLGLVAEKQGDLFGVLAFDSQVRAFVRARNGKAHYNACRDALYALEPRMVNPDFGDMSTFARLRLRRRALLIFLTNLDDPVLAESFVHNLDLLSGHHLILVNMITIPGVGPLFTGPDVAAADDLYQHLGGHIQWHKLRELEKVMKRRGVTLSLVDNEALCPRLVSQYINVKRRQIL